MIVELAIRRDAPFGLSRFFSQWEKSDMSDPVYMTREGYDKLRAEVENMENVQMPAIAEMIAQARGEGDLSENAEYHAQRENQGMLQAKIRQLRDKLARSTIIDTSTLPRDEVAFGCTVVVKDLVYDDEEEFTFVGAGEEDYDNGKYLVTSPMGQGLVGCKVGQKVEIDVPAGKLKFEIIAIRWDD